MTRVVQIINGSQRRVALVDEPHLRLIDGAGSVYELAHEALAIGERLSSLVRERATGKLLEYEPIYRGDRGSPWRLLTPIDHPADPARMVVAGTGLTHLGSARDRNAMHEAAKAAADAAAANAGTAASAGTATAT